MVKEQRFRAESEVESAVPSVSLPETLSPLCPPGADVSRQPSSPEGLSPLGGGGRGGAVQRTRPARVHPPPAKCLSPPFLLRQIVRLRSGSSLPHHSNCSVVCVYQGNSRDSKLNSNTQFIQDIRPIERLGTEPPAFPSEGRTIPLPVLPGPQACLLGPRLSGMAILPELLAGCFPILQMGLLRHRGGSNTWKWS